jgi:hypothetical protein
VLAIKNSFARLQAIAVGSRQTTEINSVVRNALAMEILFGTENSTIFTLENTFLTSEKANAQIISRQRFQCLTKYF